MSHIMIKVALSICKNKGAYQLISAFVGVSFFYIDGTITLLPKSEISMPLAIFCDCAAWFVLDLGGNPEDSFSHY